MSVTRLIYKCSFCSNPAVCQQVTSIGVLQSYMLLRHTCTKQPGMENRSLFDQTIDSPTGKPLQAIHFVFDSRVGKIRRVLVRTGGPRVLCPKVFFPAKCFILDPQVYKSLEERSELNGGRTDNTSSLRGRS